MRNYVYMLRCRDGSYYTGWTNDLYHRLEVHQSGEGAKYTKSRRPVQLVYANAYATKEEAMRAEYAMKQHTRAEKEQFLQEHFQMGKIYYLMGKSASGKDHIYEQLLGKPELELKRLVIYTTRPMRQGEVEGETYHFTDEEGLNALQNEGRVIELREYKTVHGPWKYFTVDDAHLDLTKGSYLGIGTLESYKKIRRYYGAGAVVPIYIEVPDGIRLHRALAREDLQENPKYEELCRRFLADAKDFAESKLKQAKIELRFSNAGTLEECVETVADYIREN